ncbi:hypothetical protein SYNPS1DRAFT_30879 [Syncephalis pseudoplumigaleata]|uniref:Uncharacterized protein n=1 Tax=Syncephalis pseudoplumigaleata TaxID=1712513 RepID=A0A4P9YVE6_9FUNG|nr:hypothetical protein SYNPS1DRAFT_30879 [Syncephalis pseudoplumigaleata]|eukprot:RKP23382.1 hypothetical protein SYNPS1DRAFT_30879 [Syncephalis pseudoplumigaleata]
MSGEPPLNSARTAPPSPNIKSYDSEETLTGAEHPTSPTATNAAAAAAASGVADAPVYQLPLNATKHEDHPSGLTVNTNTDYALYPPSQPAHSYHRFMAATAAGGSPGLSAPASPRDPHSPYGNIRPSLSRLPHPHAHAHHHYHHPPPPPPPPSMTYYEGHRASMQSSQGGVRSMQYVPPISPGYHDRPPSSAAASWIYAPSSASARTLQHTSVAMPGEPPRSPLSVAPSLSSSTTYAPGTAPYMSYAPISKLPEPAKPPTPAPSSYSNRQRRTLPFEKSCHPCPCWPACSVSLCCLCMILIPIVLMGIVAGGYFMGYRA